MSNEGSQFLVLTNRQGGGIVLIRASRIVSIAENWKNPEPDWKKQTPDDELIFTSTTVFYETLDENRHVSVVETGDEIAERLHQVVRIMP
jgi:hypothetical protein